MTSKHRCDVSLSMPFGNLGDPELLAVKGGGSSVKESCALTTCNLSNQVRSILVDSVTNLLYLSLAVMVKNWLKYFPTLAPVSDQKASSRQEHRSCSMASVVRLTVSLRQIFVNSCTFLWLNDPELIIRIGNLANLG
jgi:hypothetical protein